MDWESPTFHTDSSGPPGWFIETGTNRLARDLFLLTAVAALFILMFTTIQSQVVADQNWAQEVEVRQDRSNSGGPTLAVHLRRDGQVRIGEKMLEGPDGVPGLLESLIDDQPELKRARVIVSAYHRAPSEKTADLMRALQKGGAAEDRINLRFTSE